MEQKKSWKRTLFVIASLTPAMVLSLGIVLYPILNTIIRSFQDPDSGAFTFDNYAYLFSNKLSVNSIWYTLWITLATVFLAILIAYLLALYLRFSDSKISKIIGTLYLLPRFIPALVAVYAMMTIVRDSGLLFRLFGVKPSVLYNWKGIILMNLWFNIPFASMIIVAALSNISESIVESARDVGAGKLRVFFKMILPLSIKDVMIAMTFIFMSNISSFTTPYLIGPNFPSLLGVYLRSQFSNRNYEIAAATSVVIFLFSSVSAIVYLYTNMKERAWENNG